MFNKLKQYKDLRTQAKTMQNVLAEEKVTVEKNGIKVVMNGNLEILELSILDSADKNSIAKTIQTNINDAIKQTQRLMARKMQEMGGFPGFK